MPISTAKRRFSPPVGKIRLSGGKIFNQSTALLAICLLCLLFTYTLSAMAAPAPAGQPIASVLAADSLPDFNGRANVRAFGAAGDGLADDTTAIQAAIDAMYARGGGEVLFPEGRYLVSETLNVPQRVTLIGTGPGFVNQYVSNHAEPKGSVLFLKTGANTDVVLFRCRLEQKAKSLVEIGLGSQNNDARHFGGMQGMVVWGNRSADASPTVSDLNSRGNGIKISGARYVRLQDVAVLFCAEDGINVGSFNYGSGIVSSNNLQFTRVSSHSNRQSGFDIAGGDSTFSDLSAGNNAGTGMNYVMTGSVTGGIFWNNLSYGVLTQSCPDTGSAAFIGIHSYDNNLSGFRIGSGRAPTLTGCVARGNGRDSSASAADRSNFQVLAGAKGWQVSSCRSYARDQTGALVTQYGFYIDNSNNSGSIDGCTDEGSKTPFSIADGTRIITHGGVAETLDHPSIRLNGPLDLNGEVIAKASGLRFDNWTTVSRLAANTITLGTESLVTLKCEGPQSINKISYSGKDIPLVVFRNIGPAPVTFVHDLENLRCANGANVVLGQNEAVIFVQISGSAWQQIGGSY